MCDFVLLNECEIKPFLRKRLHVLSQLPSIRRLLSSFCVIKGEAISNHTPLSHRIVFMAIPRRELSFSLATLKKLRASLIVES